MTDLESLAEEMHTTLKVLEEALNSLAMLSQMVHWAVVDYERREEKRKDAKK